jgi:hypothetical protein
MRLGFSPQQYDTLGIGFRAVNCYPEPLPDDTGFQNAMVRADGLEAVYATGVAGSLSGRGQFYVPGAAGNKHLGMWGGTLLAFAADGSVTTLTDDLPNDDRPVKWAANEADVAILTAGALWIYDVSAGTVSEVVDADLVDLADIAYLNDYLIGIEAGSGRLVWALTDWTAWDALDFSTAEESPDTAVWLLVTNERLLVGGRATIEEFVPTGEEALPFQAIGASQIPEGVIGRDAALVADGTPFFLSNRRMIMRLQGGAVRISTNEIEEALRALTDAEAATVEAKSWVERGHTFVAYDIPGYGTAVYDCQSQLWHRRRTYGETYWRPRSIVQAFGRNYVQGRVTDTIGPIPPAEIWLAWDDGAAMAWDDGTPIAWDEQTAEIPAGGLFELTPNAIMDGPLPMVREWDTVIAVGSGRPPIDDYTLRGKVGVGLDGIGQGTDPQLMLKWSDDRGNTWSGERRLSLGRIGEHGIMPTARRMGRARAPYRIVRHALSDPVDFTPWGADVNVGQP